MKKKARTRLKSNFVIQPLERPIFNKPHVLSRSRQIDTSGDVWEIGESHPVSLNWSSFSELPTELVSQIKYAFECILVTLAPDTVRGCFDSLRLFFSSIDYWGNDDSVSAQLTEYLFDYIITHRNSSDETGLNILRLWYIRSYYLALSLFKRSTCQMLSRFTFKGNMKGVDVLTYMEGRSPLRSDELDRLRKALSALRASMTPHDVLFPELVVVWLYVVLGVRPRQLLLLMTCDFAVHIDQSNGQKTYMLNVPSVKKRYSLPRQQFKTRVLPVFLGELIEQLITVQYRDLFSAEGLPSSDSQPIFRAKAAAAGRREREATFERFEGTAERGFFEDAPATIINYIDSKRVSKGQAPLNMKLTPRRLRKTFATHAASMGTPSYALMELLDHDDLQHVMVYYQLGVAFALKVDAVYQKQFSSHLEYFEGKITLAELVDRNNLRVVFGPDSLKKLVGIGLCAKQEPCSLQPPYSCYSCNKFEASDNISVHQEVLDAMREEIRQKFGDDAPPGFYAAPHMKACSELVEQLEVRS